MHDLSRYSCQLALPGFSEQTQKMLFDAKVLIVGAGGLGCPVALYLASTGVGTIGIADADVVSINNLHRQILYTEADEGRKKTTVTCERLQQQNPNIKLLAITAMITFENVFKIINDYDLIIDCTDNFESRFLLNDACVISGKPLVYGAIYQHEGQVAIWNVQRGDIRTPNYRDVFPEVDPTQVPNCAEGGVLPTIAGIVGCFQANEVIKYITKTGELLAGKMMLINAQTCETRIINIGDSTTTQIKNIEHTKVDTISVQDLKLALTDGQYRIIDVRSQQERNEFNIGGEHIPLSQTTQLVVPNDNIPIIFYCETGKRSNEAVNALQIKFPAGKFFSLEGGMRTWKQHQGVADTQVSPSS